MAEVKNQKAAVRISPWTVPITLVLVASGRFLPRWFSDGLAAVAAILILLCMAVVVTGALLYRHSQKKKAAAPES